MSGFNVYPNEIEGVVSSRPGVLECDLHQLMPDKKLGRGRQVVRRAQGSELDGRGLLKFCGTQLTGYKVPKQVEFRTDLPKTNVGKILRRELRDEKKAAAA